MTKETKKVYSISPKGEAINIIMSGDPRPLEEILAEIETRRQVINKPEKVEVEKKPVKSVVVIDPDLRQFFSDKELADFNR